MVNKQLLSQIAKQIPNTLLKTDLKNIGTHQSGKVRDLYTFENKIIIVTTDRISAFDVILNQGIPYKGQALNQTSEFWFKTTKKIVENHIISIPDPNVMIAEKCKPFEFEVIIRGYITGSAWRRYSSLKESNLPKTISGVTFPNNLRKDEKLSEPVFTPTTKAVSGHDQEITPKDIVAKNFASQKLLDEIVEIAFKLYKKGNEIVKKQGGILVDTKYEFGLNSEGELVLIDEIHTADSSRYWLKVKYNELFEKGEEQKGLDKEYIRSWLRSKGFSGDGVVPDLPVDVITNAAVNVIESYELITGKKFIPAIEYASNARLQLNLEKNFLRKKF